MPAIAAAGGSRPKAKNVNASAIVKPTGMQFLNPSPSDPTLLISQAPASFLVTYRRKLF